MSAPADPNDIRLAAEVVREAGLLARRMRVSGVESERKTSVSDVVTAADRAAEALVVERLRAQRPDDGLIGEEGTNSPGARTWFIDPIDGTYNYASGMPLWCAAVALTDEDGPLLGAIYDAERDEMWTGGRGVPAACNGRILDPVADQPLELISLAYYLHPTTLPDDRFWRPYRRVLEQPATVRSLGSGSIELAWIAAGRLGSYLQYDCLPWDWLPGAAIVAATPGLTTTVESVEGITWHAAGPPRSLEQIGAALRAG